MRHLGFVLVLLAGCGAAKSEPTSVEILPLREPTVPSQRTEESALASDDPGECSLAWSPHRLGASVVTIPPETASQMMAPVLAALCACTKPGSEHSIVIDFEPGRGRAVAHDSFGDAALDRCLEPRLGDQAYAAFELGSDCIDCGPRRYGVFGPASQAPLASPPGARIRMPLQVDRRSELSSP